MGKGEFPPHLRISAIRAYRHRHPQAVFVSDSSRHYPTSQQKAFRDQGVTGGGEHQIRHPHLTSRRLRPDLGNYLVDEEGEREGQTLPVTPLQARTNGPFVSPGHEGSASAGAEHLIEPDRSTSPPVTRCCVINKRQAKSAACLGLRTHYLRHWPEWDGGRHCKIDVKPAPLQHKRGVRATHERLLAIRCCGQRKLLLASGWRPILPAPSRPPHD